MNDKILHEYFQIVAGKMIGDKKVGIMQLLIGSEDFAFYQEVIPGNFFFLWMKNETSGIVKFPRSAYFRVNEDALHASLALRYIRDF